MIVREIPEREDCLRVLPVGPVWVVLINGQIVTHKPTEDDGWRFLDRISKTHPWLGWEIDVAPAPRSRPRPKQGTKRSIIRDYVLGHPGERLKTRDVATALHLRQKTVQSELRYMKQVGEVSLVWDGRWSGTAEWVVKERTEQ